MKCAVNRSPYKQVHDRVYKAAFHDIDIDTDILARILAKKSRVSDIGVSDESVSVSMLVSWNEAYTQHEAQRHQLTNCVRQLHCDFA